MNSDFTITKREIIASISIIAIMLLIGVLLSGKIRESEMDKNEIYNKAVKIESTDIFDYGMRTNIGNAFVYGDLESVDTVTFPEIEGDYIYIKKVEEHYNRHTRTVTYKDSKGKTKTRKEVYYSWDAENSETKHAEEIKFCGVIFPYSKIDLPGSEYIETIKESSRVRFKYYGCKTKYTGTIFTELKDGTIPDDTHFHNNMNIEETLQSKQSSGGTIIFWFLWIIVIGICVYGFYYIDNNWLE